MDQLAEQYLRELEAVVAEAQRLMEIGGWREAEDKLALALATFENAGLVIEPQHEWLRIQSLHAECLFWRGEFERAESVFEAASHSRKDVGIFDWQYIRQRRYVALSKRGLCDFFGCQSVLAEARSVASQYHLTEVIPNLDADIKTTDEIRQGAFHDVAFAAQTLRIVGRNGVEILGDDRIPLQGCESLNYVCKVSQCCFEMEEPFRVRVQLTFSVDNDVPVTKGPISDGYPGCRTPILFGFLLPKGAAVHYGDFSLELNHPDVDWREKYFFLQNQFTTVFHPESYPPKGFHPIPRCKTYRYVRADFCLFRCPLPRKAEVAFAGTITFPARWAGQAPGAIDLRTAVLLPYKTSIFASVSAHCSLRGVTRVQNTIARSGYIADRVNYSPGVTPLAPKEGFEVGPSTALDSMECEAHGCKLPGSEFLTVTLAAGIDRDLSVSLQHQAHVIPTGTFDKLTRRNRRDPEGGISLTEEIGEPVPLLQCILLNTQPGSRSVELTTSCHELFPTAKQHIDVPPGGISIVGIKPGIGDGQTLFAGQGEQDHDFGPKRIRATVTVQEKRLGGLFAPKQIDERSIELTALPSDYMVWAVANHSDGRFLNLRRLIARWVTPEAPAIKRFVEGLQNHPLENLPPHLDADLKRGYEALRSHGFAYDTSRVNFGTSMEHDFQRVRLPSKSLAHRQINCIDGTVLLASVIEALGYRPAVVFVPGHAFLAVLFGEGLNSITGILCLESTGLCRSGCAGLSYEQASRAGLAQYSEHKEKLLGDSRDVTRFEIGCVEGHGEIAGRLPILVGFVSPELEGRHAREPTRFRIPSGAQA